MQVIVDAKIASSEDACSNYQNQPAPVEVKVI